MLIAILLMAAAVDWVPARWNSGDPASLDLVARTPVNCLLLERQHWSAVFAGKARERGMVTLGVIRPGSGAAEAGRQAAEAKLTGVVLEGDFNGEGAHLREALAGAGLAVVELPPRGAIPLDGGRPVIGTYQGVWPGVQTQADGAVKSAPTGAPWIDTNSGFLRFLRAVTDSAIWIGYEAPPKTIVPPARYLQAISDAALAGARWIVTLDEDFSRRLLQREPHALETWSRMAAYLKYFEDNKEWRSFRPHGRLALIQDPGAGALLSGGILDMIAVRHTPVRPVPLWNLRPEALEGCRMTVNVDPGSLTPEQREALRGFARAGGTLLSGPPGWKFPPTRRDQVTLDKEDVEKLDEIWRGVQSLIGRSNLGARLFNVASMLSNLLEAPGGRPVLLHLVNYSGYPVEAVTAHLLGSYNRARLISPEGPPRELEIYRVDEGTGVDIPEVTICATVILD